MLNLYNSTGQLDYTPDSSSDRIIIVDREDDVQTNSQLSFFDPSLPVSPAFSEFSFIAQHHNDDVAKKERANSVPILPIAFYALSDVDNRLRTARAQSDPLVKGQRSLSRKLPPKLTESLELLTLTPALQSSSAASSPDKLPKPLYHLGIDMPEVSSVPIITSSFVPPPRPSKSIKRKTSNPSTIVPTTAIPLTRRIVPSPSPPSPSFRTSTSESTYLATPTSSVHRSRASDESGSSPVACSSGSASACGTWSAIDEEDYRPKMRESRKEKKERKRAEKAAFDVDTPPSMRALYEASLMDVIGEDGQRVKFGDLVRRGTTIVIFIRHWFCPLCAQYMQSIVSEVTQEALDAADVELVIIGNGSSKMLPAYKNKAMKCPFKMYTDPTLSVYRALGLTRQTGDAGPDSEAGDYLVQTPLKATLATMKRATQMPLRNPGHFLQLGGEFVFNGTLNVTYTHRMTTTRSHAPIRDVCAEAGVRLEWLHYDPGPAPPIVHRPSIVYEETVEINAEVQEEIDWQGQREQELERIRTSKEIRRKGLMWGEARKTVYVVGEDEEETMGGSEVEPGEIGLAR